MGGHGEREQGERAKYKVAGRAGRGAMARAVASPERFSAGDWRVLAACLCLLSTYSKVADTVSRQLIADAAGLSIRQTSNSLKRLNGAGVLKWEPGRHNVDSTLSFDVGQRAPSVPAVDGGAAGTIDGDSGHDPEVQRARCVPASEEVTEKSEEGGGAALVMLALNGGAAPGRDEWAPTHAALVLDYGEAAVADAIATIAATGARWRWAREADAKVREHLGATRTAEPRGFAGIRDFMRAEPRPQCPDCEDGLGWADDQADPPVPCPTCRPAQVGAA